MPPPPPPMHPQPQSPLLQLPPELRNTIYRYTLLAPSTTGTRIQLRSLRPPPLLSTCRRIRHESAALFFAENAFVLTVIVPPMAFDPNNKYPRVHRVFIPEWIRGVERVTPLHMRDVKVEIDHAFKWVVVTMAQPRGGNHGGEGGGGMKVVEAWLHNGRQKLPLGGMRERVAAFVEWTVEQKGEVEEEAAGLNYRDVVLVAAKMLRQWAGTIVPV